MEGSKVREIVLSTCVVLLQIVHQFKMLIPFCTDLYTVIQLCGKNECYNFLKHSYIKCGLYCPELLHCAYIQMQALLPITVTLCLCLDVGCTSLNSYSVQTIRCGLYCLKPSHCVYSQLQAVLPRAVTLCIHLDVGFIAQNCYSFCTFRCGL